MTIVTSSMYVRWLVECVCVRGWATWRCADYIGADPDEVFEDFIEATK